MAKPLVVLENIRSCYNVGNIIRTADALGWDVVICGYTPSPTTQPKVKKTSLGAEEAIGIEEFVDTKTAMDTLTAIEVLQGRGYYVMAAEVTLDALSLQTFSPLWEQMLREEKYRQIAIVFGNEVVGIEESTLDIVDQTVCIPMVGEKESLNVGQTAAIFMWELRCQVET